MPWYLIWEYTTYQTSGPPQVIASMLYSLSNWVILNMFKLPLRTSRFVEHGGIWGVCRYTWLLLSSGKSLLESLFITFKHSWSESWRLVNPGFFQVPTHLRVVPSENIAWLKVSQPMERANAGLGLMMVGRNAPELRVLGPYLPQSPSFNMRFLTFTRYTELCNGSVGARQNSFVLICLNLRRSAFAPWRLQDIVLSLAGT